MSLTAFPAVTPPALTVWCYILMVLPFEVGRLGLFLLYPVDLVMLNLTILTRKVYKQFLF
ncbi:hypothetical protein BDB00DRAFT_847064 [Zychaea mexicana]|uniref:uncharacterized protein n=1 Tax=Zychaea mexicana TaxID=64656 RepID=UPI0022FE22FC|nr:uncharacterized protein BDB00DRAFT_847064 [Zychaea mexicana]KAI9488705.1 hypothetical protein BDB00DRAFT_847064 [Zychaea mexicana]